MRKIPTRLSARQREDLAALTYYPGFRVLVELMENRCKYALAEMLEISPTDPQRDEKISILQLRAFTMNEFANDLFADMNFNMSELAQVGEAEPPEESQLPPS